MQAIARIAGAAALTIGLAFGTVTAAEAYFTGYQLTVGPPKTSAWGTAGTGSIRAGQMCETSNGQTNWYVYGSWVSTRNVKSVTSSCTYVNYGWADLA